MSFIKIAFGKTKSHIQFHLSKLGRESLIGIGATALEYYISFLYGYSASVIVEEFFEGSSFLILFSALILSYIMGPIGAMMCGNIGDIKGRKKILAWTLAFASLPSFLISVLPSYDQIGIAASILFVVIRALQTLAMGGDTLGLVTFVLEEAPSQHRGLFGGFMSMGSGFGVFCASLLVSFLDPLSHPDSPWLWRIPLSFGVFGILFSIYFYRTIGETETFEHYREKHYINTWPIGDLFRKNKLAFLRVVGVTCLAPIITIVIFGFIPNFDISYLHFTRKLSMWSNTAALGVFTCMAPFFGALSDKIGRKPILYGVTFSFLFLAFPLFYALDFANTVSVFFIQLLFSIIASAYYGVTFAICVEHFSTHVRYTGVALGYYTTYALFGGINGLFIVQFLINRVSLSIAPIFYLLFGSIVALISIIFINEGTSTKLENK